MGMQNDIALLENSLAVSYKTKHTLNTSSNHALRYLTKIVEYYAHTKTHTQMFIAALFLIAKF